MIKRTIEISREPSHLTVRDEQLLILRKTEDRKPLPAYPPNLAGKIPCEDIGVIVVDERETSYSHAALAALMRHGAALVICGRDHLPCGILLPLPNHTEVVWRIESQVSVGKVARKRLWTQIVQAKVRAQAALLPESSIARPRLFALAREVRSGDPENIEAQAARLYWPELFGTEFRRTPGEGDAPNNLLDYGYAILRAALGRALVAAGLLPALGIKHSNRSNAFCLADDLIEPLRPIVDAIVLSLHRGGSRELSQPVKARLLEVLTSPVLQGAETGPLMVSLHGYTASLIRCYAGETEELEIPAPPWARE